MVGEICQCVPNYLGNRPNISFVEKISSRRPQIIPVYWASPGRIKTQTGFNRWNDNDNATAAVATTISCDH